MKISRRILTVLLTLSLFAGCLGINAFADSGMMQGIGFVTTNALRLRKEPSTNSAVIGTAGINECAVIVSKEGDWYKVIYNLQEGYMHKDYLTVAAAENAELGYGKVTGAAVNIRKGPGTSYARIAVAAKGDKCYILGLNEGWYKIIFQDQICYIRSDYLELTEIPYENKASSNSPKFFRTGKSLGTEPSAAALNGSAKPASSPSASVSVGPQILANAQQYLGVRYVSGGASPNGFDCSGLVYYVLKSLGFSPARTPADQFAMGTNVEKANLKPGDIVFFAGTVGSGISHVGIYSGNGQFLHAPNSRSVVSYSDLTSGYWAEHYYGARRIS